MSTHLGTTAFLEVPTVNGQEVLLNGGGVPSISSGTALPTVGTVGRLFLNTTTNILYRDTGAVWAPVMPTVLQVVTGQITNTSTNAIIPFDNTAPTSSEGALGWSVSFTPLLANSKIVITTSSFFTINNGANINTGGAVFSGTTCIGAQMLGYTTDNSDGNNFCMIATHTSGSTTTRTYSFRFGPSNNQTIYLGTSSGGNNYGSTTNSGVYTIMEIAP